MQSTFAFMDNNTAALPQEVLELIARGALFVVNHSGGKDSQAMYLELRKHVPADQLVIVHADLGAVEWAGAVGHILATTAGVILEGYKGDRILAADHSPFLGM